MNTQGSSSTSIFPTASMPSSGSSSASTCRIQSLARRAPTTDRPGRSRVAWQADVHLSERLPLASVAATTAAWSLLDVGVRPTTVVSDSRSPKPSSVWPDRRSRPRGSRRYCGIGLPASSGSLILACAMSRATTATSGRSRVLTRCWSASATLVHRAGEVDPARRRHRPRRPRRRGARRSSRAGTAPGTSSTPRGTLLRRDIGPGPDSRFRSRDGDLFAEPPPFAMKRNLCDVSWPERCRRRARSAQAG